MGDGRRDGRRAETRIGHKRANRNRALYKRNKQSAADLGPDRKGADKVTGVHQSKKKKQQPTEER